MKKTNSLILKFFVALMLFFPLSLQAAPPIIMSGGYKIVETGFEVSWLTDQSATTQLAWGTSPELGNLTPKNTRLERYHIDTVSVSQAGIYYYQAISENSAGEEVRSAVYQADLSTFVLNLNEPEIILNGDQVLELNVGDAYIEQGAVAWDVEDGDLTASIVINDTVDNSQPGTYYVTYNVADSGGKQADTVYRTVQVNAVQNDTIPPVIIMAGAGTLSVDQGETYVDAGIVMAQDNVDGDLTAQVVTNNPVDTSVPGVYTVTYIVSDSAGNETVVSRTVTVNAVQNDTTAPVLIINAPEGIEIDQGDTYVDPGVLLAQDNVDGDLTAQVVVDNPVNTSIPGVYTVTYSVSDSSGNTTVATRSVQVNAVQTDTIPPVIILNEPGDVELDQGETYVDPGVFMAQDNVDGDLTAQVVVDNPVDTSSPGVYTVTYSVSDSSGNEAVVSRTVTVNALQIDTTPPVIILNGSINIELNQGDAYVEEGVFMVQDNVDGDLSPFLEVDNPVDTSSPGVYTVTYSVSDSSGNEAVATRQVTVLEVIEVDDQAPVILMQGQNPVSVPEGVAYVDAGASAVDNVDGDLTSGILVENNVNHQMPGLYSVSYTVSDSSGNTSTMTRTVEVVAENTQVTEVNANVYTREIRGNVGNLRYIQLRNYNTQNTNVEIELPFYNGGETRERFAPTEIQKNRVFFEMPEGTYSGQGTVYVNSEKVGDFNYVVRLELDSTNPIEVEQGDVVTIAGSGFNPVSGKTKVVLHKVRENGRFMKQAYDVEYFANDLNSLVFQVPVGVTSGQMQVENRYTNLKGKEVVMRSKMVKYNIKPSVSSVAWNEGAEAELGSSITIRGNGIAFRPQVLFVDSEGNVFDRKRAKLISINETEEVIEVPTTKRKSSYRVIVRSARQQVSLQEATQLEVAPTLKLARANKRYFDRENKVAYFGAKIGDTVRFKGAGFRALTDDTQVVFQGTNGEIVINVTDEQLNRAGNIIRVNVPEGAVSGEVSVRVEGRSSNPQMLEIVPELVSMATDSIEPGQNMYVQVKGSGTELGQASIQFFQNKRLLKAELQPSSITTSGNNVRMNFQVPDAANIRKMTMVVKYGHFSSTHIPVTVRPHINNAVLSEDNQFLYIEGYGFSPRAGENKLVFKTIEGTNINHNNRVVKVTADGDELELKVRMNTLNTSYDSVIVQVGNDLSNEDLL